MANLKLHSLNDVKIVGRLTRDPELRYTTQGIPVCRFRVAVGRKYKDRNGEWKEEVAFVPCTVWRDTAERCGQRLKKGSPIFVEGRLKSREWQTKEGQKRSDLELEVMRIQFLEPVGEGALGATTQHFEDEAVAVPDSSSADSENQPEALVGSSAKGAQSTNEDEVPF